MRLVFGLVLLIGVALAAGAVYLARGQFSQYEEAIARAEAAKSKIVPTEVVFVAERPLKYGERLNPEDVRPVDFPVNAIPEGAFRTEEELFPTNTDEKRVILRPMEKDEAILAIKVTAPGEDAGITSRLEKGKRAFTISVDVASGVSGFLRPGDRVDVYWTGRVQLSGGRDQEVTKLIQAGIKLIAIDQSAGGNLDEATIARTVTVAVDPSQVAALAQAQSTGELSLSLVGAGDDTISEAVEVDQRSLLGIQEEVKVEEEVERVCTTKTRRGAEIVVTEIPCPD